VDGIKFRAYKPSDREACEAIIESQVGTYLARGEEEEFRTFLDKVDARPVGVYCNIYFCVGVDEDTPIGCGGVIFDDEHETATLCWGILLAGQLSKGFGRRLLMHRLHLIIELHPEIKSIFCDTAPLTEEFFAKHGFVAYYREPNYWAGTLGLVAMERSLDGTMRGKARK